MIKTQNSYKADIYNTRFSAVDKNRGSAALAHAIGEHLEEIEDKASDIPDILEFIRDRRALHMAEIDQYDKQSADSTITLVDRADKYIGRLERFSDGAARLCDGPRLRKRYVVFGEQIIKCSSPYRLGLPVLGWLGRHDTAAKALFGHIKDS